MPNPEISGSESEERTSSGEDAPEEDTSSRRNEERLSDYEKVRLKRIEENNIRMEALGLRKMASSLMGSVRESQGTGNDRKGKSKTVEEDEEYNPGQEDGGMSTSGEEEEAFSPANKKKKKKKVKSTTSTPEKQGPVKKPTDGSDFMEDDNDLMRAIALSLQDSAGILDVKDSQDAASPDKTRSDKKKKNLDIWDNSSKRKRKKPVTSRMQMSEDEVLVHFFQLDETGVGSFSLKDVRRLVAAHDFTWSEKEMSDMITCFDSDGDGKINFDDFRKIVCRCNMLKVSDNA